MVVVIDRDMSELEQTLADTRTVRRLCADPERVEIIEMPDNETGIIAQFNLGMSSGNTQAITGFLAALAPDQERIVHTSWHEFTHRRSLRKLIVHVTADHLDWLSEIANDRGVSVDDALMWLISEYTAQTKGGE